MGHGVLWICNINAFLWDSVTLFIIYIVILIWNKHFPPTVSFFFVKRKLLWLFWMRANSTVFITNVSCKTLHLSTRGQETDIRYVPMACFKTYGNDAKYVLQFLQSAGSGTCCVYSDFHLRRTGTWERKKIMSCSLWAAYRRHSAVSSSKISLCWLSTIWWR